MRSAGASAMRFAYVDRTGLEVSRSDEVSRKLLGCGSAAVLFALLGVVGLGDAGARARATVEVSPGQSIQTAVNNASAGGTIVVKPGVYHEQVTIPADKDHLTLEAQTPREAEIAAPALVGTAGQQAIVRVDGATDVTIRGFTIAGPGAGSCASIGFGVAVVGGGSATLQNNRITDIRDQPFSGCQNGFAVGAGGIGTSGSGSVTVKGNEIDGYQKGGIIIRGAGSHADMVGNAVVGAGPTVVNAQNGIQVSGGATADVVGNFVDDNFFTPNTSLATGILISGAGAVTVASNMFDGTEGGIVLSPQLAPVTVEHNQLSGGHWGVLLNPAMGAHVLQNTSVGAVFGGIAAFGSSGNTLVGNSATGAEAGSFDLVDDSTGSGSAGTENTWTGNIGASSHPADIGSPNGPITTIALHPAVPDGPDGAFSDRVRVIVSAVHAGGSAVTGTRCVLDPHAAPTRFADLPAGHCRYLGAGAEVSGHGHHTVFAMSINAAGVTDAAMRSISFTITRSPPPPPPPLGPDLTLTKTASSDAVHPGGQVTYQLVVANHGPGQAVGVTVEDQAPPGLSFSHAESSQGHCAITGGVLRCRLGALHARGDALVQVAASVASNASGTIENRATVWDDRADHHVANNTATSTVTVTPGTQPVSNLRAQLHGPSGHVRAGEHHTFTTVLDNHGPDPAADVVITFTANLPMRIVSSALVARVASAHAASVSCTSTLPVRCTLGTVPVGRRQTLRIVAVPLVSGELRTSAGVVSASKDPNPGSSVVTATTSIVPSTPPKRPTRPPPPRVTG